MDIELQPTIQVPEAVIAFLTIIRKDERIRRFEDLFSIQEYASVMEGLTDHDDCLILEDIIDLVAERMREESQETYYRELLNVINAFYPEPQPVWADILKSFVQKNGPMPFDVLVGMIQGAAVICESHGSKAKDSSLLAELSSVDGVTQKNRQAIANFICGYKNVYDVIRIDPPHSLKVAFNVAYSENSENRGGFMKAFGVSVNQLYPRSKSEIALKPLTTIEAKEESLIYLAVADLLTGNLTDLDPVIGDEACEARPPIILDIYEQLIAFCGQNKPKIYHACQGYLIRHKKDSATVSVGVLVNTESVWSRKFVSVCKEFFEFCDPELIEYLFLCKAATYSSKLACDEWDIVSYDRYNGRYSIAGRTDLRRRLSLLSCSYVQKMAQTLSTSELCTGGFWGEVVQVIDTCKAFKFDQKSNIEENNKLNLLPIYETMRTIFAYQFIKNRPIVLTVYRIKCMPDQDQTGAFPKATYEIVNVPVLVYRPDPQTGNYEYSDSELDEDEPCMSIQAYQLVNVGEDLPPQPDECNFFLSLMDDFLENLTLCDISLLTMIYSAVHPPLAGGACFNDIEFEDSGLSYVSGIYNSVCGQDNNSLGVVKRIKSGFNLCKPITKISSEYGVLRSLGISCGLDNKQYISRPGGGQVCVRTLQTVGFTIHHINVQTFGMVMRKARDALGNPILQRFHNFDNGKSYSTKDEAEDK